MGAIPLAVVIIIVAAAAAFAGVPVLWQRLVNHYVAPPPRAASE